MGKIRLVVVFGAMVSLVVGGNIQAEDVSVPHSFSSGTTIRSSEMNENFTTIYQKVSALKSSIVKAGGTSVGVFLSYFNNGLAQSDILVLNGSGYAVPIDVRDGKIGGDSQLIFNSNDCSGSPLTWTGFPGKVLRNPNDDTIYYVKKDAPVISGLSGTISQVTYWDKNCSQWTASTSNRFFQTTPNDASVTGVSNASYSLPITVAYE